ncbi:MAG: deoxyribonuclease IV [Clostridiales bacterium]|nr:deoxyribonuclease IV [Clostridiales bacterium]
MRIGAHISMAQGPLAALAYARDVGCECVQVFAKSPRRWVGKTPDVEASRAFAQHRAEYGVHAVFTHTAYLINLAAVEPDARSRSIKALADEIDRARLLAADAVITHLGTDPYGDRGSAASRIASAIEAAFAEASVEADRARTPRLLLENTAGAGGTYGRDVADLAAVFSAASPEVRPLLGVCIDTCHAHVAGIDVSSPDAWRALVAAVESGCGEGVIRALHANDAMYPFGSKRDRHAWIGDGTIGYQGFSAMLGAPLDEDVCILTEMPGEVPIKDMENIGRLKRLRTDAKGAPSGSAKLDGCPHTRVPLA